jgi:hypothetical protein
MLHARSTALKICLFFCDFNGDRRQGFGLRAPLFSFMQESFSGPLVVASLSSASASGSREDKGSCGMGSTRAEHVGTWHAAGNLACSPAAARGTKSDQGRRRGNKQAKEVLHALEDSRQ